MVSSYLGPHTSGILIHDQASQAPEGLAQLSLPRVAPLGISRAHLCECGTPAFSACRGMPWGISGAGLSKHEFQLSLLTEVCPGASLGAPLGQGTQCPSSHRINKKDRGSNEVDLLCWDTSWHK